MPTALSEGAQDTSPLSSWAHVPADQFHWVFHRVVPRVHEQQEKQPQPPMQAFLKSWLLSCSFPSCWPTKSCSQVLRHCRRRRKVWWHGRMNRAGTITAVVSPAQESEQNGNPGRQMVFLEDSAVVCLTALLSC